MGSRRKEQLVESWFHRAPRPLVMWMAVFCLFLIMAFFIGIGSAIVFAYQRAAEEGRSVPDMSGGIAAILSSLGVLIPALVSAAQIFSQRHRERLDQQARGTAPGVPFDSSPATAPGGGLVNNEALQ